MFRGWGRQWDDYTFAIDILKLPKLKQLIQFYISLTLGLQHILGHTLQITPATDKTVNKVLDALQNYFKGLRNEVLRWRELLSCILQK